MSSPEESMSWANKNKGSVTFGLEIEMLVAGSSEGRQMHLSAGEDDWDIIDPGRDLAPSDSIQQPTGTWQDPHPADRRFYANAAEPGRRQIDSELAVERSIVRAGIFNVARGVSSDGEMSDEVVESYRAMPKVPLHYLSWRIGSDLSCTCEDWLAVKENGHPHCDYSWLPVEISSAVFQTRAPGPDAWIEVTRDQKRLLLEICRSLTRNIRIRTSLSCGLHVHLGLGGDTIPMDTLRRFVTTIWLIEPAILKLCAPWRVDSFQSAPITVAPHGGALASDFADSFADMHKEGSKLECQFYMRHMERQCEGRPWSVRMELPQELISRIDPGQRRRLELIWKLNFHELADSLLTNRGMTRGAVAIRSPDGCGIDPNTIEIRYASATLDTRELTSWTNIFLRLFELSHFYDEPRAAKLSRVIAGAVDALGGNGKDAGLELLALLDLERDVHVWQAARARWAHEEDHARVRRYPFLEPHE